MFPSKNKWKLILRRSLREHELSHRHMVMSREFLFFPYLENIVDVLTPVPIWLLCKEFPFLLEDCKNAIKLLSYVYSHEFHQI